MARSADARRSGRDSDLYFGFVHRRLLRAVRGLFSFRGLIVAVPLVEITDSACPRDGCHLWHPRGQRAAHVFLFHAARQEHSCREPLWCGDGILRPTLDADDPAGDASSDRGVCHVRSQVL